MIQLDGFYQSEPREITIEAPTVSGKYTYEGFAMYRFYDSGLWIKADSLDTSSNEFWSLTESISSFQVEQGKEEGSIWLETSQNKNHSLSCGVYELDGHNVYAFFEFKMRQIDGKLETICSDIYEWVLREENLIDTKVGGNEHLKFKKVPK